MSTRLRDAWYVYGQLCAKAVQALCRIQVQVNMDVVEAYSIRKHWYVMTALHPKRTWRATLNSRRVKVICKKLERVGREAAEYSIFNSG